MINDLDGDGNPIPNWDGPYLNDWSTDPWGNPYGIYCLGIGEPLYVVSTGENGIWDGIDNDPHLMIRPGL